MTRRSPLARDEKGSSVYPVGHPRHVPEAWPLLLSRDQACAYVGVSQETFTKVCTVAPRDMGANLIRYHRHDLDAWAAGLPPRGPRLHSEPANEQDVAGDETGDAPEDTSTAAIRRAADRALRERRCRKAA